MKKKTGIMGIGILCVMLTMAGCKEEKTADGESAAADAQTISREEAAVGQDTQEKLAQLRKENADAYAWLEITGTDMSWPVLQSAEDLYFYLSHNEEKQEDNAGSIYTEYYNNLDFGDPNTIIYGRNVPERFGKLHQFQDRDFFDTHREIRIFLPDRTLTYQIFGAYSYDDRHLIMIYDFWDEAVFAQYLSDVWNQRAMDAYLDKTVEVTAQDKIITLSTGVTGEDDKRYLVQAVLVDETE